MWCGVVWCGVVWCGVVWCGVVWCGVVWCGVVWCGVVWYGTVSMLLPSQVEKAGGQSSGDGKGISGLDIVCEKHDQVSWHTHPFAFSFFIKHVLFDDRIKP